ncbi:hypothetical protein HMPREF9103_03124 [Lentilactobacillus parafarraginis F0439]|uniref:Uncharacterized protein n=1 Tax=Lentilactobacillus parafarraginis F0439 TaxID=797515 RepID=G9ZTN9_9LACO|nr:hypothetical protein HMPREF9103_03124 [Lentilactobacillus parafarraginis F0439]
MPVELFPAATILLQLGEGPVEFVNMFKKTGFFHVQNLLDSKNSMPYFYHENWYFKSKPFP